MDETSGVRRDVVLAPFTTYKIGGKADFFFVAKNKGELVQVVLKAREESVPVFILGEGANILFGDKGFRGLVVKNEAQAVRFEGQYCVAESGVTMAQLIAQSLEKELSGFEHFAGIPSTVGGALWQNLHFLSPDRSSTVFISDIFVSADILDESGEISRVEKAFFEFGYDTSILHHKNIIVLEATFSLFHKGKEDILQQVNKNLSWRSARHPNVNELPSCGSVFKKIDGVGAGRLIEKLGLKGSVVGGAQVSHQHANFIVNTGNSKASDIRSLIEIIQRRVKEETGYELETEISFVGEF